MKHKLTRRLIAYFSIVLLLFALISALLFSFLFARHTAGITTKDLRAHADSISGTLSQFVQEYVQESCRGGGFKAYLRFMSDNSMSDLYLLDREGRPVSLLDISPSTSVVPAHLLELVQSVFESGEVVSASYSSTFLAKNLAAGAPVFDQQGQVVYALLLYSPVSSIRPALANGLFLLSLSLGVAMFLAVLLSVYLSRRFVTPLRRMMDATTQITAGHYDKRTNVSQNDELGVLASPIDALSAQLEIAEQERRQLDQMRQDFLSDISHELRTPITVLKGSVEMLQSGMIHNPADLKQCYDQLHADTLHLQRLVNDLLDLNRLQNTHFSIDVECVNLIDILYDTLRSMRPAAEHKQITIRFDPPTTPVPVMGDYGRLRQLMTILLDNAIKFSHADSSVTLQCMPAQEKCIVTVTDHGIGMDEETQLHIFDRYFHSRSALNRSGTGLGLPIAWEIARRHQIEIACESIPNQQTCFTLTIPLCTIPEEND